jgi:MoaA/NifB/PqqE/SkfB family radical SAM enzyme
VSNPQTPSTETDNIRDGTTIPNWFGAAPEKTGLARRFPVIQKMLERIRHPSLDWIQVEVTSHCNARCSYCPHTTYADSWINRHLPLDTFKELLPSLPKTNLVYLQGWGEPFLNPDFFEMTAIAKNAGCQVGVTTSGMLLDHENIEKLIALDVDIIAFSLAGIDARNDSIRVGTRISTVFEAVDALQTEKEKRRQTKPDINIAYVLLRSGIENLRRLPTALEGKGVSQIIISTLDYVPNTELENETIIPADREEFIQFNSLLASVVEDGRCRDLDIHYYLRSPGHRRLTCTENVQHALFLASDGTVSPCVFTNLPVSSARFVFDGVEQEYRRITFGNVNNEPLARIWRNSSYRAFRKSFLWDKLVFPCAQCHKLYLT